MKLTTLTLVALLTSCANMTDGQKQTAWIVGSIIVVGAIVSANQDSSDPSSPDCFWVVGPNGSTQVCN